MNSRLCVLSLSLKELEDWFQSAGYPAYRARQVFAGVYRKGKTDFMNFTELPLELRKRLSEEWVIYPLQFEQALSSVDGTTKYLFKLQDGNFVETVLIPAGDRKTACLSTQVGCKYRCAFCASGLSGFKRNLTTGEIIGQILALKYGQGQALTNLVFMGMGEPLDNLENVLKAIRILNDKQGLAFGARRITVSTAGHIPGIRELKNFDLQINLSISIHSPYDSQRSTLMPINRKYPLEELLAAAEDYLKMGGRQLTLEYVLIKNLNDGLYEAEGLGAIARRLRAKVNLIAYSPVPNLPFERPGSKELAQFRKWLEERGVRVTVRQSKGIDIAAACGQLAGKFR